MPASLETGLQKAANSTRVSRLWALFAISSQDAASESLLGSPFGCFSGNNLTIFHTFLKSKEYFLNSFLIKIGNGEIDNGTVCETR